MIAGDVSQPIAGRRPASDERPVAMHHSPNTLNDAGQPDLSGIEFDDLIVQPRMAHLFEIAAIVTMCLGTTLETKRQP